MGTIEELKKRIENKEVTAYKVAKAIGVNPSVITRIINGFTQNPNEETLLKIENYLLGKENTKNEPMKYSTLETNPDTIMSKENYELLISYLKKENDLLRSELELCQEESRRLKKYT